MEILGVFATIEEAARAVDRLVSSGISEQDITSLTSVPYPSGVLVNVRQRHKSHRWTLFCGALGAVSGFLLAAGTAWLYPLQTGDKPIISVFPVGIITYELMMLMAIIGTLLGMFRDMQLPDISRHAYAPEIADGHIGILVLSASPEVSQRVEEVLEDAGALRLVNDEVPK